MNITHLTYHYDVYYRSEKLDNILDMEYEVLTSTMYDDYYYYAKISITYIDGNSNIKHIESDSQNIKFEKRNERSKLCSAKEEE